MALRFPIRFLTPRLKTRAMLILIAIIATGLGTWREYSNGRRAWRQAIHAPKAERIDDRWMHNGSPRIPPILVLVSTVEWPISGLQIDGLSEAESLAEIELAMKDPYGSIRQQMYWRVNQRPPSDPSVGIRLLSPGLEDVDRHVRVAAVQGLRRYVGSGKPLPPKFFRMLDDPEPLVRENAFEPICAAIADPAETSIPGRDRLVAAVLARLDDPDSAVRRGAIEALDNLLKNDVRMADRASRVKAKAILDAIEVKLNDPRPGIRSVAAFVLASHGRGLEAVPILLELDKDPQAMATCPGRGKHWPRESLALLAGRSDEAASVFFDYLGTMTGHPNGTWQMLAGFAGWSPEAYARIERIAIQRIANRFPYVQAQLALILDAIGSSRDVLPELIEGASRGESNIQKDCIQCLKARKGVDPEVLHQIRTRLREAARSSNVYEAEQAVQALKVLETR